MLQELCLLSVRFKEEEGGFLEDLSLFLELLVFVNQIAMFHLEPLPIATRLIPG
jgi:hypothetical protein